MDRPDWPVGLVVSPTAMREAPTQVYGGLLTTLMRLVFVLYAEDRDLMPAGDVYQRHYSLAGHRLLLGAACYGCLLLSESSCEKRNDFLDRALVVPTVDSTDAAFFGDEE